MAEKPMTSLPVVNLLRGWPNRALLPVDRIREAAQAVLSEPDVAYDALEYGPDHGYEPCREAIADWLASFYQPKGVISPKRVCITGGASQNMGCLLEVFSDPEYTRNVWIVVPGYFLAFRIFDDAGFGDKLRAVPEDEQGIDLAFLRREMQKSEEAAKRCGNTQPRYKRDLKRPKVYKHFIYCVPTFSNPSSRTMSLARRRELVRLAREFDALIVPDDVYDFLLWPADVDASSVSGPETVPQSCKTAHLPRLVDVDRDLDGGASRKGADGFGNACSNGTFSKLAGPGIRTGWVEGTETFANGISQNGTTKSGGAPSQLTSTYVTRLLHSGHLQEHIRSVLLPAYSRRYRTMVQAIDAHLLPLGFTMPQPNRTMVGGYFVWLALPDAMKAVEFAERCQTKENIIVAPGKLFAIPGDEITTFERSIRLCFAYEDETLFGDAIRRMAVVAEKMLESAHLPTDDYVVVEKGVAGTDASSFNHFA